MKTPKNTLVPALGLIIVLGLVGAQAEMVTWDGSEGDDRWDNEDNWDTGTVPLAGDEVFISNGDAVIGLEFNTSFTLTLSGGSTLLDPDTGIAGNAWRAQGAKVTVNSGSTLGGGGFYDLQNATLTFEDGAAVNMRVWEQKDLNIFNFNLSAGGFTAITPGEFNIGNGALTGNISNATYNVDMAAYTGGTGILTLADFGSDVANMDNATFQGAKGLNVVNSGNYNANLQWNDTDEAIELNITAAIPEPSVLGLFGVAIGLLTVVRRRIRLLYTGN